MPQRDGHVRRGGSLGRDERASRVNSLRHAFGFLTILPVTPAGEPPGSAARAWFPFVGLALGAALVGLDAAAREGLPPIVIGALLLCALLILTRALHAEGFLDCCDGLFGGYTAEDRLRILRDTHVGAFAVIGGTALIAAKWSLLASTPDEARVGLLLVFPCLSRFGMLLTMAAFPYTRAQGVGTSLQQDGRTSHVAVGVITAVLASVVFLGAGGLVLLGAVSVAALGLGRWLVGKLGGMTGDGYGAVNELGEVLALLLGIALVPALPDLFEMPIW
ncbi:MAG: adenosylcobinamide-GDP ribazoletransferase [Chloroflexi bacterium]|nr:adenosylcobinamide-GDP ribazoletransferase [Chloroflexota bacterium]MYF22890.1 adenosylcobinamide-GDP ribazoletransferase [Chloroflexota bacterium]